MTVIHITRSNSDDKQWETVQSILSSRNVWRVLLHRARASEPPREQSALIHAAGLTLHLSAQIFSWKCLREATAGVLRGFLCTIYVLSLLLCGASDPLRLPPLFVTNATDHVSPSRTPLAQRGDRRVDWSWLYEYFFWEAELVRRLQKKKKPHWLN